MKICGNCVWLKSPEGECRRNAPRLSLVEFKDGQGPVKLSLWPEVKYDDWCGEFKAVEAV